MHRQLLSLLHSSAVRPRARALWSCLVLAGWFAVPAMAAPPLEQTAPDFALRTLDGENRRLSEHPGEVVLINFWASWSGPSRQELPVLQDLHAKYQRAGLVLFGVNLDDDIERAKEMVQTLQVTFPVLVDRNKEVARSYDVSAMPLTVLIDREGRVRFVSESFKPGDEARYAAELRKLLNE